MKLTEYAPIIAAVLALIAAMLAWTSKRKQPQLDAVTIDKMKTEIDASQAARMREKALADARRDRHIVRLEQWAFEKVRPWGMRAVLQDEEKTTLLMELAARADIPYEPKHLPPFPEMPQIDDE